MLTICTSVNKFSGETVSSSSKPKCASESLVHPLTTALKEVVHM